MKVLITAHTHDENGMHFPGDVIDLSDGEAQAYSEKNWGIIIPAIETAESKVKPHETAMRPAPGKKSAKPVE